MTRPKYLKSYQKLAAQRGAEPLEYMFKRFRTYSLTNDHVKAEQLAMFLIPFGHARQLPKLDEGDVVLLTRVLLE